MCAVNLWRRIIILWMRQKVFYMSRGHCKRYSWIIVLMGIDEPYVTSNLTQFPYICYSVTVRLSVDSQWVTEYDRLKIACSHNVVEGIQIGLFPRMSSAYFFHEILWNVPHIETWTKWKFLHEYVDSHKTFELSQTLWQLKVANKFQMCANISLSVSLPRRLLSHSILWWEHWSIGVY